MNPHDQRPLPPLRRAQGWRDKFRRRGYDRAQVDAFIAEYPRWGSMAWDRIQKLEAKVAELEKQSVPSAERHLEDLHKEVEFLDQQRRYLVKSFRVVRTSLEDLNGATMQDSTGASNGSESQQQPPGASTGQEVGSDPVEPPGAPDTDTDSGNSS